MAIITDALSSLEKIKNGATIMIGGFEGVGVPEHLIDTLIDKGIGDLTIITNDTSFVGIGIGKLIDDYRVSKLIASHIGTNPETGRQMNSGKMEVSLIPQGSLVESIRAGGFGLGGILTPTGLGTVAEENKRVIEVDGKPYLLELPIKADFALLYAKWGDRAGNLKYHGTMVTFNTVMAMAADTVIAEVDEIVEDGYLDPDGVHTPGIMVDYMVKKAR